MASHEDNDTESNRNTSFAGVMGWRRQSKVTQAARDAPFQLGDASLKLHQRLLFLSLPITDNPETFE